MIELFNYKRSANLFVKCIFTEVHQFYLCSEKFPKYLNTIVFKYYCNTEFVYVHQASTSLIRIGIIFQNKLHISGDLFLGGRWLQTPPPPPSTSLPPPLPPPQTQSYISFPKKIAILI